MSALDSARVDGILQQGCRRFLIADLGPPAVDALQGRDGRERATALARIVADYVAGMTDRFAIQEHARLMGVEPVVRAG